MRRRRLRHEAGDDRGSMVIAISVIMVLSALGAAVALRAVGAAFVSVGNQDAASAVSQADAGLADALYRIDQGTTGTGAGTAFCVEAGDPKCIAASVPAAPGVSYLATQVSGTDWLVRSVATVNGMKAAVEGHVTQQSAYPFALFGGTSLDFNGKAAQSFSSYSPSSPAGSAAGQANPDPNGAVTVGSNGGITCPGQLGSNVTVMYYGAGGVGSTASSACGTYRSVSSRYYLSSPTAPADAFPCPGTGTGGTELGSGFAGAPTLLPPGTYLCNNPVTFSGVLEVGGPVQLYVILDPSTYGSSTPAVTIAPGSYVNDRSDYCANGGATGCAVPPDLPTSQNLEIWTNGTGAFGAAAGSGFYLGAVVHAPAASVSGDGCQSHYYGSLVVDTLACTGGPGLFVSYDTSLSTDYGPWTQGAYTQINPSAFTDAMAAAGL